MAGSWLADALEPLSLRSEPPPPARQEGVSWRELRTAWATDDRDILDDLVGEFVLAGYGSRYALVQEGVIPLGLIQRRSRVTLLSLRTAKLLEGQGRLGRACSLIHNARGELLLEPGLLPVLSVPTPAVLAAATDGLACLSEHHLPLHASDHLPLQTSVGALLAFGVEVANGLEGALDFLGRGAGEPPCSREQPAEPSPAHGLLAHEALVKGERLEWVFAAREALDSWRRTARAAFDRTSAAVLDSGASEGGD